MQYEDPIDPMETYLNNLKKKLIADHDSTKLNFNF